MNISIEHVFDSKAYFDGADIHFCPNPISECEFMLGVENSTSNELVVERVQVAEFTVDENAPIYMEGYQALSQTAGTMGNPVDIGRINEVRDYRLYGEDHTGTYGSNFFMTKVNGRWFLIGATSSFRTGLVINLVGNKCKIFWELGSIIVPPLKDYYADHICFISDDKRSELMEHYAYLINTHHRHAPIMPKSGWCSWYCYYDKVTGQDILENLDVMSNKFEGLEYVQIDDGYQMHMGDWLTDSDKLGIKLQELCEKIKASGKKPAIWVAPFIASEKSEVFTNHPDWFIKGSFGNPLKAESITYGGWRETPWYLLDMTIPEVRSRITKIFKAFHSMGIDYFKLDACYWGAIKGLKYHTPSVSHVVHYRLGIDAIRQGVGYDSYIMACNAPLWPSLGLVNAFRITDDVERSEERIKQQVNEFRYRNWMANRLWGNDVDCLVGKALPNQREIEPKYYHMLFAMAVASGGPILIGDKLSDVSGGTFSVEAINKLAKGLQRRKPAYFIDENLTCARSSASGIEVVFSLGNSVNLSERDSKLALLADRYVTKKDSLEPNDAEIFIDFNY